MHPFPMSVTATLSIGNWEILTTRMKIPNSIDHTNDQDIIYWVINKIKLKQEALQTKKLLYWKC